MAAEEIRRLGPGETRLALDLLGADPVLNLGLIHAIMKSGLNNLGLIGQGTYLGLYAGDALSALLCHDNQGVWRFQVNDLEQLIRLADEALHQELRPVLVLGEARPVQELLDAMGGEIGYLRMVDEEVVLLLDRAGFHPRRDGDTHYASPGDLERVIELEEGLQKELLGPDIWRKAAVRRFVEEQIEQRHTVVCVADGTAVAKADLEARTAEVASLGGVFTLPDFRRRGFAASACSRLCADILDTGARITLNTDARNLSALALYRSLGFRKYRDYKVAVFS